MKKKDIDIMLLFFVLASTMAFGQNSGNDKKLIEQIRTIKGMQSCFENNYSVSLRTSSSKLKNGKIVNFQAAENFKSRNFNIVDKSINSEDAKHLTKDEYNQPYTYNILSQGIIDGAFKVDYSQMLNLDSQYKQPFTFHLVAHGVTDKYLTSRGKIMLGGKELSPEECAEVIISQLLHYDYILDVTEVPFTIILHSCKSGDGDDSFAAHLSSILAKRIKGVAVIASPDLVYSSDFSDPDYKERITYNVTGVSANKFENWNVFKEGKLVNGVGTHDYKTTWTNYVTREITTNPMYTGSADKAEIKRLKDYCNNKKNNRSFIDKVRSKLTE